MISKEYAEEIAKNYFAEYVIRPLCVPWPEFKQTKFAQDLVAQGALFVGVVHPYNAGTVGQFTYVADYWTAENINAALMAPNGNPVGIPIVFKNLLHVNTFLPFAGWVITRAN